MVLVRHVDDPQPIIADGSWHGQIIPQPRGNGGFGYDPHFYLPELGMTSAELPLEQKNKISHRSQALIRLVESIKQEMVK
jgi:XTP/dITP diphosphohydrolase